MRDLQKSGDMKREARNLKARIRTTHRVRVIVESALNDVVDLKNVVM